MGVCTKYSSSRAVTRSLSTVHVIHCTQHTMRLDSSRSYTKRVVMFHYNVILCLVVSMQNKVYSMQYTV